MQLAHLKRLILGILGPVAASPALAAPPLELPPEPETRFYVRYRVDGRLPVEQKLYGFRYHPYAVLVQGEDSRYRSLRLTLASARGDSVNEALSVHVQDRVQLDTDLAQRFKLTGQAFCKGMDEQPNDLSGRAEYQRARQASDPWIGLQGAFPQGEDVSNLEQDATSRLPRGYVTGAPGLGGAFEGELVLTKIDRKEQIIEGHFRFDAGRHLTARRGPHGEWAGRCSVPSDFQVERVALTSGAFRVRYCLEPAQPSNSRFCPGGLAGGS